MVNAGTAPNTAETDGPPLAETLSIRPAVHSQTGHPLQPNTLTTTCGCGAHPTKGEGDICPLTGGLIPEIIRSVMLPPSVRRSQSRLIAHLPQVA